MSQLMFHLAETDLKHNTTYLKLRKQSRLDMKKNANNSGIDI